MEASANKNGTRIGDLDIFHTARKILGDELMRIAFKFTVCTLGSFFLLSSDMPAKKLKKEELVSLHLKSIGENLAPKTRLAQGIGTMDLRVGGSGKLGGPAVFVSEGEMLRSSFMFKHTTYAEETAIRNGNKIEVRHITPGQRSQLGDALWNSFPKLMQEGLYGGVLGTDWALVDVEGKRPKLDYRGLKEFDDRKVHELRYRMRKGVGYNITLYFEPETYRHIASRYRLIVPAGMGRSIPAANRPAANPGAPPLTPTRSTGLDDPEFRNRITLEERFQDFKEVDGLTLPHTYRLSLNLSLAQASFVGHWEMKFNNITHNRAIDSKVFKIK